MAWHESKGRSRQLNRLMLNNRMYNDNRLEAGLDYSGSEYNCVENSMAFTAPLTPRGAAFQGCYAGIRAGISEDVCRIRVWTARLSSFCAPRIIGNLLDADH